MDGFVKCSQCYYGTVDWPWVSPKDKVNYCNLWCIEVKPDDFCSRGVRGSRDDKRRKR